MPVAEKQKSIEELLGKATGSLARQAHFEAERMALKALLMARQLKEFDRMIDATEALLQARAGRAAAAMKAKKVTVVSEQTTEKTTVKPGCYLVEPPLVGADARRLRLAALQNEVPIAVLCREPLTQLKQWPVVAIGAGTTIRMRIAPPKDDSKPDMGWFTDAMEQLGDWAVLTVDPTIEPQRRIDVVLERLDAVPEHRGLHELLIETCREAIAAREAAIVAPPKCRRGGRRTKMEP